MVLVKLFCNGRTLTNQWIVPYSPYLTLKYNCHINIEICASAKATKYLYKYVSKSSTVVVVSMLHTF